MAVTPLAARRSAVANEHALGIAFLDLRRCGQCKFPLWPHGTAPAVEEMFFCGREVDVTVSYCSHHKELTAGVPLAKRAG
jgi:hypothetical protein